MPTPRRHTEPTREATVDVPPVTAPYEIRFGEPLEVPGALTPLPLAV